MAEYRLGRHHKDTVYLQIGAEPSDQDRRIAIFMPPLAEKNAAEFVKLLNQMMRNA